MEDGRREMNEKQKSSLKIIFAALAFIILLSCELLLAGLPPPTCPNPGDVPYCSRVGCSGCLGPWICAQPCCWMDASVYRSGCNGYTYDGGGLDCSSCGCTCNPATAPTVCIGSFYNDSCGSPSCKGTKVCGATPTPGPTFPPGGFASTPNVSCPNLTSSCGAVATFPMCSCSSPGSYCYNFAYPDSCGNINACAGTKPSPCVAGTPFPPPTPTPVFTPTPTPTPTPSPTPICFWSTRGCGKTGGGCGGYFGFPFYDCGDGSCANQAINLDCASIPASLCGACPLGCVTSGTACTVTTLCCSGACNLVTNVCN